MDSGPIDVRAVFNRAQEIESPDERAAYLDQACDGDAALRSEIVELLVAADQAGSFMQGTAAWETTASSMKPLVEGPGTIIGPYKLLQKIGEGGMGVVFMAEQTQPVHRTVALKIIKPGMDSQQVIARFEAERQALALMDHPNIARVLDAGATDSGRPYFVMELVKGVPITQYCDDRHLTPRERLKLFQPVCQAVQHAHQKGVIHRDLKPTNVLVAEYDNQAVPKVIDFGVAKATSQRLTERTMFTEFGQVIGTVDYMSPEQAKLNQLDIDTRTDVYSLGVLLYELLTGETPFDRQRLRSAAFDEMLRIIREEEPPRPSTRISSCVFLPSIAESRQVQPEKLARLIRGELDWIVMKALDKDRNRRYESASGLAGDIDRYLHNEPVLAGPPSPIYRLGKLASKHRGKLVAGAALFGMLVAAVVISTWQAVRAVRAERQAAYERDQAMVEKEQKEVALTQKERALKQAQAAERKAETGEETARLESAKRAQVAAFMKDMLQGVGPSVAMGRDTTMLREILERTEKRLSNQLQDQPTVEAELRDTIGQVYVALGLYEKAVVEHRRALQLRQNKLGEQAIDTAASLNHLGYALWRQGFGAEADVALRKALVIQRELLGEETVEVAQSTFDLANVLWYHGALKESESLHRHALTLRRKLLGDDHADVAASLIQLSWVLAKQSRFKEAEACSREALAIQKELLGPEHPDVAWTLCGLAVALQGQDDLDAALRIHRDALAMREKLMGPEHLDVANSLDNLARVLEQQGRLAEAEDAFRRAYLIEKQAAGQQGAPYSLDSLIRVLRRQDKTKEADILGAELLRIDIGYGRFLETFTPAARGGDEWIDMLIEKARKQDLSALTRPLDILVVGELRLIAGDVDSAVEAMRIAADRTPGLPSLQKSLGWALEVQGRREKAREAFLLGIARRRQSEDAWDFNSADPDELTAAYFLDLVTESQYVERLKNSSVFACFPWFYIGQRKEIEGDIPAAIAAYESCVAAGNDRNSPAVWGLARWRLNKLRAAAEPETQE